MKQFQHKFDLFKNKTSLALVFSFGLIAKCSFECRIEQLKK
jgi:hypothetical protein